MELGWKYYVRPKDLTGSCIMVNPEHTPFSKTVNRPPILTSSDDSVWESGPVPRIPLSHGQVRASSKKYRLMGSVYLSEARRISPLGTRV